MSCYTCSHPDLDSLPWTPKGETLKRGAITPFLRELGTNYPGPYAEAPKNNYVEYQLFSLRTRMNDDIKKRYPNYSIWFNRFLFKGSMRVFITLQNGAQEEVDYDHEWLQELTRKWLDKHVNKCAILSTNRPLIIDGMVLPKWWIDMMIRYVQLYSGFDQVLENGVLYIDLSDPDFTKVNVPSYVEVYHSIHNEMVYGLHQMYLRGTLALFPYFKDTDETEGTKGTEGTEETDETEGTEGDTNGGTVGDTNEGTSGGTSGVVSGAPMNEDAWLIRNWELKEVTEDKEYDIFDFTEGRLYETTWQDSRFARDRTLFLHKQRQASTKGLITITLHKKSLLMRHEIAKVLTGTDPLFYEDTVIIRADTYRNAIRIVNKIERKGSAATGECFIIHNNRLPVLGSQKDDIKVTRPDGTKFKLNRVGYYNLDEGEPVVSNLSKDMVDPLAFVVGSIELSRKENDSSRTPKN